MQTGEVWVLGDNRNNSSDSRAWNGGRGGGVPFELIKGRAMFVWMSFWPDGGINASRLLFNVMGKPTLPKGAPAELVAGIERCLAQRPGVTLPPPSSQRYRGRDRCAFAPGESCSGTCFRTDRVSAVRLPTSPITRRDSEPNPSW